MSKYKPLYSSIWTDNQFEEYSPNKKLIYIFLLTSQFVEKSGIYKISIRQISFHTGVINEIINEIINELIKEEKIKYDFQKGVIFIKKLFKYQKGMIKNEKIMLLTLKRNYDLVSTGLWDDFFEMYKDDRTINILINEVINGSLMPHQLYINKNINKDKDINKNKDKKPKKPKIPKTEIKFEIPEFIGVETWNDFVEYRKELKAKLTTRAIKLIIKDLVKFENNKQGNANIALENTIKSGKWTGVFEPKPSSNFNNNNSRIGF